MTSTKTYYLSLAYGIPFGAFCLIFLLVTMIHKRVSWFVLHTVLGIDWSDKSDQNNDHSTDNKNIITKITNASKDKTTQEDQQTGGSNNSTGKRMIKTYLYIDFDGDYEEDISPLRCIERFLSDILASAVLAIFVAIIFDSLILSSGRIMVGAKCPAYAADCFGKNRSADVGPFSCDDNKYANFSVTSKTLWCVGWVYQNKNMNDVLDTLGTCGGLLGIISSIVPFVYYLSYYKRCFWLSCCCCILLPSIPLAALGYIIYLTSS